jgi:serine/threonine protein kinase
MTEPFPSIPNFDLLTKLGSGGMGHVYLGKHRGAYGFEKLLAVKVIRPERDKHGGVRAMFLDEARLVAQLHHPAIAQVYDFGESDRSLYLVMEYVTGVSISQILIENRRPPPLICAAIAAAVCRGLHAAHEAKDVLGTPLNVVHRDVTPSNLVLTFAGQMKILDFGIALMRHRSAPVTSVGHIRGKPTYFSPEQIEGAPIDRRTDIYSLAIVLYEILTGTKLFTLDEFLGRPAAPKDWKRIASLVQAPSKVAGPLPRGFDEIVLKGLAVEPSDRYQDARAMAVDLEAIIEREGCETLEAFVEREFALHREAHEARMRAIVAGVPVEALPLEHPGTLDDDGPAPEREEPTEPHAELPAVKTATVIQEPPSKPRLRAHAAVAGAIVLAAALLLFTRGSDQAEEPPPPAVIAEPPLHKPVPPAEPPPKPEPKVVRAEAIVLPREVPIEPARTIEKRPEPARKKPKKRVAPRKTARKPSKSIPSDGIMTEW